MWKWVGALWKTLDTLFSSRHMRSFGDLVRYLYFLRFSIMLWLLPLVLCALNETGGRTLMSGIVTPIRWVQYLCVSFFLVAAGFQSLILARIVLIHGLERFNHKPPLWLARFFAAEEKQNRWLPHQRWFVESLAPLASQLSNVVMFVYFFSNGGKECVDSSQIAWGLAAGVILALFFWYAVCGFYYLTYDPPVDRTRDDVLEPVSAATLVLPRWMFFLSENDRGGGRGDVLERANVPRSNQIAGLLAWLFPHPGYKKKAHEPLYEAHYFAMVAVGGFVGLYLALCPLTAPMPMPMLSWISVIFYAVGGVAFTLVTIVAQPADSEDARRLRMWKIGLGLLMLIFSASIPALYFFDDGERFPILALVLILVMGVVWLLGALGFFLDRFRVPVLTAVIVIIVLPRMLHLDGGKEEHYLSISLRQNRAALSTPARILSQKLDDQPGQPLIIVTSTGGGIHAATWTAAVLEQLENKFSETDPGQAPLGSFHNHVLLMSTVSGGSVGLYTYLHQLDPKINNGNPQWDQMKTAAECSSLEAVGWGLVYYDIPKALVPVVPYFLPPSSGVDDLRKWPLGKDRTWSLRRAFARNLHDAYCNSVYEQNPNSQDKHRLIGYFEVKRSHQQNAYSESELTAGNLNPNDPGMPAFTMNTTIVEGGYRFLSANYQVPTHPIDPLNAEPAESFLQVYGGTQFPDSSAKQQYTDIPLATGAQLSATFPLVSSAATFPAVRHKKGVHFVDGGYYDNDGTVSAIEFLRAALDCWEKPEDPNAPPPDYCANTTKRLASGKLRIILVEIRNSPDLTATQICCLAWQDIAGCKTPWNLFNQLTAPLAALWGAGHDSITDRNRNALQVLKLAYQDRLDLQHFVIDDRATAPSNDPTDRPLTDPLNWSLTPAQQFEVTNTATNDQNCAKYAQVKSCFLGSTCDDRLPPPAVAHDACKNPHP